MWKGKQIRNSVDSYDLFLHCNNININVTNTGNAHAYFANNANFMPSDSLILFRIPKSQV